MKSGILPTSRHSSQAKPTHLNSTYLNNRYRIFETKLFAIVCILILIFHLGSSGHALGDERKITVVFRFDDYSAISDTELELKILDIFRKNNAAITYGVIPYANTGELQDKSLPRETPLSKEKALLIRAARDEGTLEIGMHGYNHKSLGKDRGEFIGVDYQTQFNHLAKGKQLIEELIGGKIRTFIPPWNKYDQNTLTALDRLDFEILSASITAPRGLDHDDLTIIPFTCHLRDFKNAFANAEASSNPHLLIVVLFHAYDFLESDRMLGHMTIPEFADIVQELAGNDRVTLMTLEQAASKIQNLNAKRYAKNESIANARALLPSFLHPIKDGTYAADSLSIWIRVVAYYAGIFFGMLSLGLLLRLLLSRRLLVLTRWKLAPWQTTGIIALAAILMLAAAYLFDRMELKPLTAICSLIGVGSGFLLGSPAPLASTPDKQQIPV